MSTREPRLPDASAGPRARRARRARRGFTLVELLVAMTAGLAVATAALLLARNASRFFQYEARFSSAHMAALLGMNRITNDLRRAGLLSSPNVLQDPSICGSTATWPDGMRRLSGVTIVRNGSWLANVAALAQSDVNGLRPDSLVIGGAFGSNEQFDVQAIYSGAGGGWNVQLQALQDAMKRTDARTAAGGAGLDEIFLPGRLLRIVTDKQPSQVYGVISGFDQATLTVRLDASPALPIKDAGVCGVSFGGSNSGFLVNAVSRVRYDIRSLQGHPRYGALVAPISPEVTGDNGRTELVRVELDAYDAEMPDTLELVAEYAVDLKFGISTASLVGNPSVDPQVQRYPVQTPEFNEVYSFAADVADNNGTPQRIRSVQVRLSTRTRAPDRDANLTYPAGVETRRLRFLIPGVVPGVNALSDVVPPGAPAVFARMRTLQAEVALPNHERAQRW